MPWLLFLIMVVSPGTLEIRAVPVETRAECQELANTLIRASQGRVWAICEPQA